VQEVRNEDRAGERDRIRGRRHHARPQGARKMIQLKSAREIEIMAEGGRILAATIETLRTAVRPGISTGELDRIADDFIRSHEGAIPAFKGLYGFTGSICASINHELVHGIPSPKRVLKDGDIGSLEVGG